MANFRVLTVAQITTYLKSYLEENEKLSGIYISGEVNDFRGYYASGHLYFSLRDPVSDTKISAVMFRTYAQRLRFDLNDGMKVIIRADVSFYPKNGTCQLTVFDIQPDGLGSNYLAFEQLKEKLSKEGLFDPEKKKAIPLFPERIGVVTSAQGAAVHDITTVLERRWPLAKILFTPASVQGDNAPEELRKALIKQDTEVRPDIIIIGRGGGSADDLSAFNDEALARAIFACKTPVISAVGHEIDYSISDFVADLRAPTPSAAAEIVAPDYTEYLRRLDEDQKYREDLLLQKLEDDRLRLLQFENVKKKNFTDVFLLKYGGELEKQQNSLLLTMDKVLAKKEQSLEKELLLLDSHNPAKLLERSVCIPEKNGKKIRSILQVSVNDRLLLHLSDGTLETEIKGIERRDSFEKKFEI